MARNTLENALRWQEHLGNNTTCHSCAVSQALGQNTQKETKVYSCTCGEIILHEATAEDIICQKCGQKMNLLNCCTHYKE